jgi:hypothetical protein
MWLNKKNTERPYVSCQKQKFHAPTHHSAPANPGFGPLLPLGVRIVVASPDGRRSPIEGRQRVEVKMYSAEREEAVLRRMIPPENKAVSELAREAGITEQTLYRIVETRINCHFGTIRAGSAARHTGSNLPSLLNETSAPDVVNKIHEFQDGVAHDA